MRLLLKSKIHNAMVTDSNLNYEGSIEIDQELLERADIWPGERVLVTSLDSGERIETYVIAGKRNSGKICINGAAARKIKSGEKITIMSFIFSNSQIKPKIILVNGNNKFLKFL